MMFRRWLKSRLPDRRNLQLRLGLCERTMLRAPGEAVAAPMTDSTDGNWSGSHNAIPTAIHPNWWQRTLLNPAIWHLNRRSAAGGAAVGLFVSWLPVPLQMLVAAVLAVVLRVHVPVSVVMVWFTNPLTVVPQLYAAWWVGSILTHEPPPSITLNWSLESVIQAGMAAWPAMLVGCLFLATVSAVVGYYGMLAFWRLSAIWRWRCRRLKRQQK